MSIIHRFFELAAHPSIIGPHSGFEADLLLSGHKPIGFISILDEESGEDAEIQSKNIVNVKRLNQAVEEGQLKSRIVRIDNFTWPSGMSASIAAYFYCQKEFIDDMETLADNHEKEWKGGVSDKLPKDIGNYLGYSDKDIELFNNGGYKSLNPFYRFLMERTHKLRKACRIKALTTKNTTHQPH